MRRSTALPPTAAPATRKTAEGEPCAAEGEPCAAVRVAGAAVGWSAMLLLMPGAQILSQLFDAATAADDLTDEQKAMTIQIPPTRILLPTFPSQLFDAATAADDLTDEQKVTPTHLASYSPLRLPPTFPSLHPQLFDAATAADDLTDEQKARICATIAAADKNLVDGADEWLQLLDVASSTMRAVHNLPLSASFAT
ncbi:unnamed protein product [Closterium sp. NIES-65]|nr:unnamed protein product [Closterium sp. NIES-65]